MVPWRDNYSAVRVAVAEACAAAQRQPGDVQILAISKFQPAEAVAVVAAAGQQDFGENYVQEWQEKCATLAATSLPLRWHMTGHVQHRKAKDVAGKFALLHTLDSQKLADALEMHLAAQNLQQPVLLEINIGAEPQKAGVLPENALALAEHVLARCPRLSLEGLMCLPPVFDAGPLARPFFADLRKLRDRLELELAVKLPQLSMGMSGDFSEAIAEGATIVRIGTSIFGSRPPKTHCEHA